MFFLYFPTKCDLQYEKVEPRWVEFVRLWLENPDIEAISDEQLISIGEQVGKRFWREKRRDLDY